MQRVAARSSTLAQQQLQLLRCSTSASGTASTSCLFASRFHSQSRASSTSTSASSSTGRTSSTKGQADGNSNGNSNGNGYTSNRRFFDSLSQRASPNAEHFTLADRPSVRFTVRPAPSVVPPTLPIPQASSSITATQLPPPLRTRAPTEHQNQLQTLTPEQIVEMQELRLSNPTLWTRGRLAAKYNCSPFFVGLVGFGGSSHTQASSNDTAKKAASELVKSRHQRRQELQQIKWGFKKRVDREVRRRRKEFW